MSQYESLGPILSQIGNVLQQGGLYNSMYPNGMFAPKPPAQVEPTPQGVVPLPANPTRVAADVVQAAPVGGPSYVAQASPLMSSMAPMSGDEAKARYGQQAQPENVLPRMPEQASGLPMDIRPDGQRADQANQYSLDKFKGDVAGFMGGDSALALAAGILEGGTNSEALGRGFGYALAARNEQKKTDRELAKTERMSNLTADFLRNSGADPSLIALAEGGFGSEALSTFRGLTSAGENQSELEKYMDRGEAETWQGYLEKMPEAAALSQDIQVLQELLPLAPQGALQGRLFNMFPGFNTAGDAFNSVVYRVAPSLRTPGSGSTSDTEYDGFLRGLPNLRNTPEANVVIAEIVSKKAQIDIARGELVNAYRNGDISERDVRKGLSELAQVSIISPEMKRQIEALKSDQVERPQLSGVAPVGGSGDSGAGRIQFEIVQ